jgi:hypothetical protein
MPSAAENIALHQEDIAQETQKMMDVLQKSEAGIKMMEASSQMASSGEMQGLMGVISDPEVTEDEHFLMGQYLGQMLQADPENGLKNYSQYADSVANNPDYEMRKEYYSAIADASLALDTTNEFKQYVETYKAFDADQSPEAQAARDAMQAMQEKVKMWSEEGNEEGSSQH